MTHPVLQHLTQALIARSQPKRQRYLAAMAQQSLHSRARLRHAASNQAHGYAALPSGDKIAIKSVATPMLAIVSAYNDVLSAHQPLAHYPEQIKATARAAGAVAQFAGGVPAMCDGVTQGAPGMDLSLFSRDVIAQSAAVALTHDLYDGALMLGVCDKIVPGLLIGALSFGHLPTAFIAAGPMPSGLSNDEKAKIRKQAARGEVGPEALLAAEMAAYHSAGTCTFYGTANSNQLLLEAMGLMLPGAAFVQPTDPRRKLITDATTRCIAAHAQRNAAFADNTVAIANLVDERCIINAVVALLATGGSTNHTLHWVAIARAAGIDLQWSDFAQLSDIVPLLTRVYPNGSADVNAFHEAGGTALVFDQLLRQGLMHGDAQTITGQPFAQYALQLSSNTDALQYHANSDTGDASVIAPAGQPFAADGGLKMLSGNIGRAVIKNAAVKPEHYCITAPAKVFDDQDAVLTAFKAGQLNQDCVVVVRGQGPKARGMPELHKLTPALSVLLDQGFKVALVTDGRMSGASGRVPAAIHLSPEAAAGGAIARLQDGDMITVDCHNSTLSVAVNDELLARRSPAAVQQHHSGFGRDLFSAFRQSVGNAENGASIFEGAYDA